ncbi:MAG: hypothetical protein HOE82_14680 [Gammaproteobacteria bacterium]|jgi:hypothetical protein|nr:hypothetical protein [Gammaproteobacteria bacterium]
MNKRKICEKMIKTEKWCHHNGVRPLSASIKLYFFVAATLGMSYQQACSEEIVVGRYFPHNPQAVSTYIETPESATVTEKTRDKRSGESVLEQVESNAEWVQEIAGGEQDQAKIYWSYQSDGLYLHEMSYPGIKSQSKGTATLGLKFVPPVKVMIESENDTQAEASSRGHIRYKIAFDPIKTDGFLGKTSQTNAKVDDSYLTASMTPEEGRWIYKASYNYQGREGRTIPLQQGDAELCALKAARSIEIDGVLNGKPIHVQLNTTNWLVDKDGMVESNEQIELEYNSEIMSRTLQKKLTMRTPQQKLIPTEPLTEAHLSPGWNMVALPLLIGDYGDNDREIAIKTMKNMVTPKENAGRIIVYGQGVSSGKHEWSQYAPCSDQMTGDAQGVTVIDSSNKQMKGAWIKVGANDRIVRPTQENMSSLTTVEKIEEGWGLIPIPELGGLKGVEEKIEELGFGIVEYYQYNSKSGWAGGKRDVVQNQHLEEVSGAAWIRLVKR